MIDSSNLNVSRIAEGLSQGKRFDMTDLIHHLIRSGRNVVTYPVNENDYIDIGQWDEYKKAIGKI